LALVKVSLALGSEPSSSAQHALSLLQLRFSSGVSLAELRSVAVVVAEMGGISPPPRDSKRSFQLLIEWFVANWACVGPWLAFIELRDAANRPIDRMREMVDRGMI
jgi:hypothetical protein